MFVFLKMLIAILVTVYVILIMIPKEVQIILCICMSSTFGVKQQFPFHPLLNVALLTFICDQLSKTAMSSHHNLTVSFGMVVVIST